MFYTTNSYLVVFWTGLGGFLLLSLITGVSYYLTLGHKVVNEKVTAYECGFQPFHLSNLSLETHFFLIGLSFLIFDMEVMFLYPWFQVSYKSGVSGIIGFIFFFTLIVMGFIIEYLSGVFKWNKVDKN